MPFAQMHYPFENKAKFEMVLDNIIEIADQYPGDSDITVMLKEERMMKALGSQFRVEITQDLLAKLKAILGEGKVLTKAQKLKF